MTLSDEQILTLAKEHGASYTNRHEPVQTSYGFMRASMLAFARALLAKQDHSGSDSVACMAPGDQPNYKRLYEMCKREKAALLADWMAGKKPEFAHPAPGSAGNEVRPTNQPVDGDCLYCHGAGCAYCSAAPAAPTPTVKQTPYGPAVRMDALMDAERREAAIAALRELLRVKKDRNNQWPLSEWLITWNNAWFHAQQALAKLDEEQQ